MILGWVALHGASIYLQRNRSSPDELVVVLLMSFGNCGKVRVNGDQKKRNDTGIRLRYKVVRVKRG